MAVTTENSTQYANFIASPPVLADANEYAGRMRIANFNFTQGAAAGDATSTATLVKLPAGKVRVYLNLSIVNVSALGAARTADLGWQAYTNRAGTAVAADPNGLDDGVDVSSAVAYNPIGTIGGNETKEFDSRDGVVIDLQINDGTIPAAATVDGYLVYVND